MKYKRASFSKNKTKNILLENSTAKSSQWSCTQLDIQVKSSMANIFNPIEILLKYELSEKISQTKTSFCKNCVVVNPIYTNMKQLEIAFEIGCANETCKPSLKLLGDFINIT